MPRSRDLGKLVQSFSATLSISASWEEFVRSVRGRPCLAESVRTLPHPAAPLLHHLRTVGAPVSCKSAHEWSADRLAAAIERGSHGSTRSYLGFLESDMVDMCRKSYWIVLPYKDVQHLPNLRLSPLGVVPQRERRPRIIVDYTFSEVNQDTISQAPLEAMQFGRALDRLLHAIHTAPEDHGPTYLLKVDLSDGFYRIPVAPRDVPQLGVAFPTAPGEEKLVAFPITLPMGWKDSPPTFCAATETVVDLANHYAHTPWAPPPHHLEQAASTHTDWGHHQVQQLPAPRNSASTRLTTLPPRVIKPAHLARNPRQPLYHADVYVDDEILAAQGTEDRLNRLRRQLLHLNDAVFRPNDQDDDPQLRREPISTKKLLKGDACWSTRKVILGWTVDTLRKTIELPPHRAQRLLDILNMTKDRSRISVKHCHRLLGELRSMLLALPGGSGLLSQLQHSLKHSDRHRVRLTQATRHCLADLHALALDVAERPTRLAELFPTHHGHYYGACDAAKSGFGGVLFPPPSSATHPLVWRAPLPAHLQQRLISDANPRGTITNSDLELAGTVLQDHLWVTTTDCRERTVHTCCDNTPAVAWRSKGSVSTNGPAAYLLRLASLQQRHHRHVPRLSYIPGPQNTLADMASRRFDLNDSQLLAALDHLAPQTKPWRMQHPTPAMLSCVISALQSKRPEPTWGPIVPVPPTRSGGTAGSRLYPTSGSPTHCSPVSLTKSPFSASLHNASAMADSAGVAGLSELRTFVTRYYTSRRRSPNWGPRIRDSAPTAPPIRA